MINYLILPVFLFFLFIYAYKYKSFKELIIGFITIFLAILVYFTLGVIFDNCARFQSIPFGGCSYTDDVIIWNLNFWYLTIFLILNLLTKIKIKQF